MINKDVIYFDNAANHLIESCDIEQLSELLKKYPANIESRHAMALSSKTAIKEASKNVISALNLNNYDLLYFGSGSEIFTFFNHVLRQNFKNKNIITSKLEHPALLKNLSNTNLQIKYLDVNNQYQFDKQQIKDMIDDETILVVLNFVQSETGLIQELDEIILTIRKISPNTLILIDTIQGIGKLPLPYGADFYTVSNHKLTGTYGAGLIYKKDLKFDIEQEYSDYRHKFYLAGRLETANLLLMNNKLVELSKRLEENYNYVKELNKYLREGLVEKFSSKAILFFEGSISSPYILHIIFPNYDGAILAGLFSERGIMVSSTTACMSEAKGASVALKSLRIPKHLLFSTIRVSLSENNKIEEVKIFLKQLEIILENY